MLHQQHRREGGPLLLLHATSEPMHDPAETLQAGASGIEEAGSACSITQVEATSTGKRTVGALDDASSPDRTRCRRGARGGGLDVAQSVPGSDSMGDPSTVAFVPSPPCAPIILSPLCLLPFFLFLLFFLCGTVS